MEKRKTKKVEQKLVIILLKLMLEKYYVSTTKKTGNDGNYLFSVLLKNVIIKNSFTKSEESQETSRASLSVLHFSGLAELR